MKNQTVIMSRAQIDKAEAKDFALGGEPMRPRDAATMLMLDRRRSEPHVLLGRRSRKHAFMPGKYVFPGGRTDPHDGRVPVASELDPAEQEKLLSAAGSRANPTRAKAWAMSAIRETYEEAGLLIGRKQPFETNHPGWDEFVRREVQPALDQLRFVARAITPPGRVRRFDTRFFAVWRDEVALELKNGGPTQELEKLVWLPLTKAVELEVPTITRTILTELARRLEDDPDLQPGKFPVPYYRLLRGKFMRQLL